MHPLKSVAAAVFTAALTMAALPSPAADFRVSSPELATGRIAPAQFAGSFGCTGANQSPRIVWQNPPMGTQSFVVTLYDPDAPTGSGWWHWAVADIPADATELPAGAGTDATRLPPGAVQINTDTGSPGYLGPCPPMGQTHRYVITVTALKVDKLKLPANATPALLGFMANANSLGKATLSALGAR